MKIDFSKVILVINVELHWMIIVAGLEVGTFMEILSQQDVEANRGGRIML